MGPWPMRSERVIFYIHRYGTVRRYCTSIGRVFFCNESPFFFFFSFFLSSSSSLLWVVE